MYDEGREGGIALGLGKLASKQGEWSRVDNSICDAMMLRPSLKRWVRVGIQTPSPKQGRWVRERVSVRGAKTKAGEAGLGFGMLTPKQRRWVRVGGRV